MSKKQVFMSDYSIINDFNLAGKLLVGKVVGHPTIEDNKFAISSPIVRFIDEETVETMNTIYKLGSKSGSYKLFLKGYNVSYTEAK